MFNPADVNQMNAAKIGGSIISKTLDALNKNDYSGSGTKMCSGSNNMSDTYHLSKSVLSAAYQDKGILISSKS